AGFRGQIDEVRIKDVAFSATEIANVRSLPLDNPPASWVAYYRFDDLGAASAEEFAAHRFNDVTALADNADFAGTPANLMTALASAQEADATFTYLDGDGDNDGIADVWEGIHFGNTTTATAASDADGDTMTDLYEFLLGWDPRVTNTQAELDATADADGLSNIDEQTYGTDPNVVDTDDDGTNDGAEVAANTDPADSRSPFVLQAMSFAAGDTVTVPVNAEQQKLNLATFTVETWVKPTTAALLQTFVTKSSGAAVNYAIGTDIDGDVTFTVGGQTLEASPDARLVNGQWAHIAAVSDGTALTLTVTRPDPEQPAEAEALATYTTSAALTSAIPTEDGLLTLGSAAFIGLLDEVRIWSAARTAAQLDAARQTALTGAEAGLAAYYPFDDGGTTVEDFTQRLDDDVDGTVAGATFVADAGALTDADSDGDLLDDAWEIQYFGDLNAGRADDTDGDGLDNLYEFLSGRNPLVAEAADTDTDNDGLSDIDERAAGTHPLDADTDDDGFTDGAEVAQGTSPRASLDPLRNQVLDLTTSNAAYAESPIGPVETGDMAVEAWVKLAGADASGVIVEKARSDAGVNDFVLELVNGDVTFTYRTENGGTQTATLDSSITTADGWVHVAAVLANNTLTLLVSFSATDLDVTQQFDGMGAIVGAEGALRVGSATPANWLPAYVDEVRVWNSRTVAEVQAERNQTRTAFTALARNYRFDDGQAAAATGSIAQSAESFTTGTTFNSAVNAQNGLPYALILQNTAAFATVDSGKATDETYSYLLADIDGDGLPDFWENQALDVLSASDGTGDTDGDTM
ncbi:MAG: LamG domain-containing protein, partial [Lentisphaerae bacterium]|nr:LamG domain-containing protein [Lentisphaerota bacterium]